MKKIKFVVNLLLLLVVALGQWSCEYDPYENDIASEKAAERLELSASAAAIALDKDNLQDVILSFDWSDARQMSDEYVISYTTKLDLLGNNFGSTTVIRMDEDEGIYRSSFTSEQLNNWANEKWKIPINKPFTLEFRVTAEWKGGPTFEAPEVRTVYVEVQPIKVEVFDADKMSLTGSALSAETEIEKTQENTNLYAWLGEMTIGEVQIPVELDGATYYISPANGDGTLVDGEAVDVKMQETPVSWGIKRAGEYRLVIDMIAKQVTFYSPEKALEPLAVTFRPSGAPANPETTIMVTELWAYGAGTGWGVKKLNCTQSLADPQVLVYSGSALASGIKFCIAQNFTVGGVSYNQNNAYCFTCPLTAEGKRQNLPLTQNKEEILHGGADGETRNSYYTIPSGSNLIIFDLRNKVIIAKQK